MLAVFYQTLDPNAPKWQLDNSLIGSNPGLGFRPMPPESNVESTLIWYKASDEGNYLHWTRELDKFLEGEQEMLNSTISILYVQLLKIRYLSINEQFEIDIRFLKYNFSYNSEYERPTSGTNNFEQRVHCEYGRPAPPGKVCDVDMTEWGQCTKAKKYGFHKSAPCIFLKLNKVCVCAFATIILLVSSIFLRLSYSQTKNELLEI